MKEEIKETQNHNRDNQHLFYNTYRDLQLWAVQTVWDECSAQNGIQSCK